MLGSLLMKRATEIICPGDANQADQRRPGLLGRPYTKAVYGAMRRGAAFPLVISLPVRLPSGALSPLPPDPARPRSARATIRHPAPQYCPSWRASADCAPTAAFPELRSEEHTSEIQS